MVAVASFAADGLEGASLNGILERAGMGKSSFYHRFADKAALHDWVVERLSQSLLGEVEVPDVAELTAQTFRPRISALVADLSRSAVTRPETMALGRMFHDSADAPGDRRIAEVRASVLGWIAGAVVAGRAVGAIRDDLPDDLLSAWAVSSLLTIDQWVLAADGDIASRGDTASTALDALWDLLAPR